MFWVILAVHAVLCTLLVGLVLLQQGKGADSGAVMGASNADSFFGASGAGNILTRSTTSIAVAFMVTSLLLVRSFQHAPLLRGGEADPLKGSVMEGGQVPVNVAPAPPGGESAAEEANPAPPAVQAPQTGSAPPAAPPAAAVAPAAKAAWDDIAIKGDAVAKGSHTDKDNAASGK